MNSSHPTYCPSCRRGNLARPSQIEGRRDALDPGLVGPQRLLGALWGGAWWGDWIAAAASHQHLYDSDTRGGRLFDGYETKAGGRDLRSSRRMARTMGRQTKIEATW